LRLHLDDIAGAQRSAALYATVNAGSQVRSQGPTQSTMDAVHVTARLCFAQDYYFDLPEGDRTADELGQVHSFN
jgi:hypothetical protein